MLVNSINNFFIGLFELPLFGKLALLLTIGFFIYIYIKNQEYEKKKKNNQKF